MQQPLSDIRVIDLTRILSGPFCSQILGDLGADVIKLETPGRGDPTRSQGDVVNGLSWYFAGFNRNKRSITLDLRQETGRAVLRRLLKSADVLLENFRPGVMAEMGFDADTLKAINPRLIVASINGYGSTGPDAHKPSFDFIAQAQSGFMATNGFADGPPVRTGAPISDLLAGVYAALGIVSALRTRDRDGAGQAVEAAMQDSLMSMLAYLATQQLATGQPPARSGNDHPAFAPYGLYQAADGAIAVATSTDKTLQRFLQAIGLTDLVDDPRYDTNGKRLARRDEVTSQIERCLSEDVVDAWIERLSAAGVPCGRVRSMAQAFEDPQVRHREMVIEMEHPTSGTVKALGFPIKLSETPCVVRHAPPDLGADTDAILAEAGYDSAAIDELRAAGILGNADLPAQAAAE